MPGKVGQNIYWVRGVVSIRLVCARSSVAKMGLTRSVPLPYRFLSGAFSPAPVPDILPNPPAVIMENQTVQSYDNTAAHTILLVEDFDDTRLMMKMC
jgi:hypothetical protein